MAKKKATKAAATKKVGAGPGRRQCPKCEEYVGVRTHRCACGHAFPVKSSKTKPKAAGAAPDFSSKRSYQQAIAQTQDRIDAIDQLVEEKAVLEGRLDALKSVLETFGD